MADYKICPYCGEVLSPVARICTYCKKRYKVKHPTLNVFEQTKTQRQVFDLDDDAHKKVVKPAKATVKKNVSNVKQIKDADYKAKSTVSRTTVTNNISTNKTTTSGSFTTATKTTTTKSYRGDNGTSKTVQQTQKSTSIPPRAVGLENSGKKGRKDRRGRKSRKGRVFIIALVLAILFVMNSVPAALSMIQRQIVSIFGEQESEDRPEYIIPEMEEEDQRPATNEDGAYELQPSSLDSSSVESVQIIPQDGYMYEWSSMYVTDEDEHDRLIVHDEAWDVVAYIELDDNEEQYYMQPDFFSWYEEDESYFKNVKISDVTTMETELGTASYIQISYTSENSWENGIIYAWLPYSDTTLVSVSMYTTEEMEDEEAYIEMIFNSIEH